MFRFSSGIPIFLFESFFMDLFIATEVSTMGTVASLEGNKVGTVVKTKVIQKHTFSTSAKPLAKPIPPKEDISNAVMNLVRHEFNGDIILSPKDQAILRMSKILSQSEHKNLEGAELLIAASLQEHFSKPLINSDAFFLNESLFILHPDLSASKHIEEAANEFVGSRKNKFTLVLNALDDENKNF